MCAARIARTPIFIGCAIHDLHPGFTLPPNTDGANSEVGEHRRRAIKPSRSACTMQCLWALVFDDRPWHVMCGGEAVLSNTWPSVTAMLSM